MTEYMVNATLTVPAWLAIEANSASEAVELARDQRPQDWETDMGSAEIDYNVTPVVSEIPF